MVTGGSMSPPTALWAFADALLALEELGHEDVAANVRERWHDVPDLLHAGGHPEDLQTTGRAEASSVG